MIIYSKNLLLPITRYPKKISTRLFNALVHPISYGPFHKSYQQILEEGEWGQFVDEGEWTFHIPNEYSVLDKSIFAYENEECWEIEEYFDNRIITACECTLLNNE